MPASLQDLPAELLLNILEMFPREESDFKLKLYKAVRATCTDLNTKTLYFFGSAFFRKIRVEFSDAKLMGLSRSTLGFHVQHITLDFQPLFDQTIYVRDQDVDEDSESSSSDDALEDLPLQVGECKVREDLAILIRNGTCGRELREALSAFQNLRYLRICPPHIRGRMLAKDVEGLRAFWLMTCKLLLGVVLPEIASLETFAYNAHGEGILGLPLSLLGADTAFPVCLSSSKRLKLFMVTDLHEDAFSQNVEAFASLFRKLTNLAQLRLALTHAPASYFDRFARALPRMTLHTLELVHTTVTFEALSVFIKTTAPTLRCFDLLQTSFTEHEDFTQLLHLLIPMQMERCSFGIIDVGKHGLDFTEINKMRPEDDRGDLMSDACQHTHHDSCAWVWVEHNKDDRAIFLSKDNDGNVGFWLRVVSERVKLQEPFECDTLLLGHGM